MSAIFTPSYFRHPYTPHISTPTCQRMHFIQVTSTCSYIPSINSLAIEVSRKVNGVTFRSLDFHISRAWRGDSNEFDNESVTEELMWDEWFDYHIILNIEIWLIYLKILGNKVLGLQITILSINLTKIIQNDWLSDKFNEKKRPKSDHFWLKLYPKYILYLMSSMDSLSRWIFGAFFTKLLKHSINWNF